MSLTLVVHQQRSRNHVWKVCGSAFALAVSLCRNASIGIASDVISHCEVGGGARKRSACVDKVFNNDVPVVRNTKTWAADEGTARNARFLKLKSPSTEIVNGIGVPRIVLTVVRSQCERRRRKRDVCGTEQIEELLFHFGSKHGIIVEDSKASTAR